MDENSFSNVLTTSYSIIFIVGLVGNVIALYVFLCIHRKRNSIQIYLLNVAIADLLLIFCLPFRIMHHINQNKWTLGIILCKAVGILFYMNMYISIVLLGLISLDRYIKINRSIQQRKATAKKQSIIVCCAVWTTALTGFLAMTVSALKKEEQSPTMCFHYRHKLNNIAEAIINLIFVVVFWLIFLLIILSYLKISRNLLKISKRRSKFPNSSKYATIARNSLIVLIIFAVCFVPYHVFRVFYILSQLKEKQPCSWKKFFHKTNEIMLVLSALNSCFDPVMYFLMSSNIRKIMCKILSRRFQGEASRSESTSEYKPGYTLHDTSASNKIQYTS
ncbi:PREDICTED: probable G-protein coupled receptor 34 [Condylura cristata]|uniref:probable G-protein coupled receptor 34 n=1 Tax=Condylura cristata TaxID=143302 RepID=UPI000642D8A1|nr:PREDICTED: probable G-protein coupled receptor 34 [Condylura cristata]